MTRPATTYRRDSLAIGVGVGVFGVTFGVLAGAAGLTITQACVMSLLVFTGASQFAAVAVINSGGGGPAALGTALLLAARNGLYGVAMSRLVRGHLPTRLLGAHLVIDETTAMATAQTNPTDARRAFWMTGALVFAFWNVGTLLGAVAG